MFGNLCKNKINPHPAPFPVALIISSTTAQIMLDPLDPFIGSGTTAVSAIRNGKNYIGIEVSEEYCNYSRERINHTEPNICNKLLSFDF